MSSTTCQISVSLDGFVAGPNQSVENPLGEGGMRLHDWGLATHGWREQHGRAGGERNADSEVIEKVLRGVGAYVTDGIESALRQARAAAGNGDVAIAGGASAVRQYLAAGLLDELYLHIVPVVLGAGERLLRDVGSPTLEPVEVVASPAVTHVRYRVAR